MRLRPVVSLHSCGLLSGSLRPAEAVCMLRTLVRDKTTLTAEACDWLRRMQKSLDQMNVRVLTTSAAAWSALLLRPHKGGRSGRIR
jgi:hypothetical protein